MEFASAIDHDFEDVFVKHVGSKDVRKKHVQMLKLARCASELSGMIT